MILQNRHTPEICAGCVLGKSHRHSFLSRSPRIPKPILGYLVHADICRPMVQASLGGALYYLLFKDDHSGFRYIFCIAEKSKALQCFQNVFHDVFRDTGNSMQILRTDGGGEFTSKQFREYLSQKGVRHEITAPYSPEKNGLCERDNRTIMDSVCSLLHSSGYPLSFWAEACHTVIYTLNRTGSGLIPGNTPFTLWYGTKPSLEHLRVFGCQAYAFIDKRHRNKLDPKSHLCFFLGYCDHTKGYRLWDPVTSKVLIRRDVIFNEKLLYGTSAVAPSDLSSSAIYIDNLDTRSTLVPLHHAAASSSSPPEPTPIHEYVIITIFVNLRLSLVSN